MTNEQEQRETVTLLGEQLPVRMNTDDSQSRRAISLLREQVDSVREQAPEATRLQIALLSGLNLAGRIARLENEPESTGLSEEIIEQMNDLENTIDSLLEPSNS